MAHLHKLINYKEKMATAVVIPARLASTRFPRKMLVEVTPGVTLIEHVYAKVCKIHPVEHVYVATDSQEIADLFPDGVAILTSESCKNGTERVAEASYDLTWYSYFINVQGDMIDLPGNAIATLESFLINGLGDVVTVCKEMKTEDRNNPSTVKCINNGSTAHWFCRAPLEYGDWHLGLYGYTREALQAYEELKVFKEEDFESLEQLRWLQNYYNIDVIWTEESASEINTPEDLTKWQESTAHR